MTREWDVERVSELPPVPPVTFDDASILNFLSREVLLLRTRTYNRVVFEVGSPASLAAGQTEWSERFPTNSCSSSLVK